MKFFLKEVARKIGEKVEAIGWVHTVRDKGGIIFFDLRDRSGRLQVVAEGSETLRKALRPENLLRVKGKVAERVRKNPHHPTGDVELVAEEWDILAEAPPRLPVSPVLPLGEEKEELRFKYRYLDLRRLDSIELLFARHTFYKRSREFLWERGFVEVETPYLIKSTPEGARDFVVPSRLKKGSFYALPQSPQLFKQMLMVGGVERYFQFARCFRDEDPRKNRLLEHTQLDVEVSFWNEEEIIQLGTELFSALAEEFSVKLSFARLTYEEAMMKFRTDKPKHLLYPFVDVGSGFLAFKVPGDFSRKKLDDMVNSVERAYWVVKMEDGGFRANWKKLLEIADFRSLPSGTYVVLKDGDGVGEFRVKILDGVVGKFTDEAVWVTEFPMFEEGEDGLKCVHHPFTLPAVSSIEELRRDPLAVKSRSYDIVVSGEEVGGGSLRIHDLELQKEVFRVLGYGEERVERDFGFFLEALKYSPPPHGGIGIGVERSLASLLRVDNVRELVAFPKSLNGECYLTGAPMPVPSDLLAELGMGFLDEEE